MPNFVTQKQANYIMDACAQAIVDVFGIRCRGNLVAVDNLKDIEETARAMFLTMCEKQKIDGVID